MYSNNQDKEVKANMSMKCPTCKVDLRSYSTEVNEYNQVRRRRICPKCKSRFQTIEISVEDYNNMAQFFNGFIELIKKYSKSTT